jgi:hypothetical protein
VANLRREFRTQLTKERGEYLMRKEIWAMLAAIGEVIVTVLTIRLLHHLRRPRRKVTEELG